MKDESLRKQEDSMKKLEETLKMKDRWRVLPHSLENSVYIFLSVKINVLRPRQRWIEPSCCGARKDGRNRWTPRGLRMRG